VHDHYDSFREVRCNRCLAIFYLCTGCDHGQSYCGTACRDAARTDSRRAANRRHQRSREGRRDHARRQAEYRCAGYRHHPPASGRCPIVNYEVAWQATADAPVAPLLFAHY
jgi:hypothetical protein